MVSPPPRYVFAFYYRLTLPASLMPSSDSPQNTARVASTDNYSLLIAKLDAFTRKYYLNALLRGTLYATAVVVALFLFINLLEYAFYLPTTVRKVFFYGFIGTSVAAISAWILYPLLQYFRLGRVLSHERAAAIIGEHFPNVKDKLLNILQLRQMHSYNTDYAELINASIKQKSEELKPVPFVTAINLANNRRYLRYALPPLALLFGILAIAPSVISDSTHRIIDNNTVYEKPAPFQFRVENTDLRVVQYEDYKLTVDVDGSALPADVFIDVDGFQYKLQKESATKYSYTFSKVQDNARFRLTANGFNSKPYELAVLKKPTIAGLEVALDYPAYTGRKDEQLSSVGDLLVPAGTHITWMLKAANASKLAVRYNYGAQLLAKVLPEGIFSFGKTATESERYTLFISNAALPNADSVGYSISVAPDLFPTIQAQQFPDSTDRTLLYFAGDASDDYGISRLTFNFKLEGAGRDAKTVSAPIKVNSPTATQFDYRVDVKKYGLKPGDKITYYFEVFDNDGVKGPKSARTNLMTFEIPTAQKYQQMENQNNQDIKNDLAAAVSEARQLEEDIKKMNDKMLQKKNLNFQDKKEIEKLLEKQKDLEKKLQEAKQNFDENMKNQDDYKKVDDHVADKQEQLKELFDKLMSPEMKDLMQKMQDLLDKLNKDQTLDNLDKMDVSNKELEKELDRMTELFKQLELEQKLTEAADKLDKLAKEQEDAAAKNEKDNKKDAADAKKAKDEQDALNKKFDDAKKEMKDIEKKNDELERPNKLEDTEQDAKDIEQDQQKSSEDLQQQQQQKASKSQKKAAAKMKNLANKMRAQMQQQQQKQNEEDMRAMRQLLENLVTVSFAQESVMNQIQAANPNAPGYVDLVQKQFRVKEDFRVVDDSLQAIAKRNFQIKSFVTEKVTAVNTALRKSLDYLEDRQRSTGNVQQQRAMTGMNDLALMLQESLQQMQQQQASSMPASAACKKPGSGKGKKPNLGQMQQQLNDVIKKMGEGSSPGKDGKPQPNGKDGKGGKAGGSGASSKQFAEAAAKQAAIRKALSDMQQKRRESGKGGDKGTDELLKQMDKTEEDLVNKRLTQEMVRRQQDILTRLLENDKADREREYDEERQAETAKQKEHPMPPALQEYLKKRQAETELYRGVSPLLRPYYKTLVEQYYNTLRSK